MKGAYFIDSEKYGVDHVFFDDFGCTSANKVDIFALCLHKFL